MHSDHHVFLDGGLKRFRKIDGKCTTIEAANESRYPSGVHTNCQMVVNYGNAHGIGSGKRSIKHLYDETGYDDVPIN